MSPDNPDAIGIAVLAKAPVIGTVKTRLAMMLGVDGATLLHERLLRDTIEKAVAADLGPVTLWCAPDERHAMFQALASEFPITLARQPGGDLGGRMLEAFGRAGRPALVVGTDCPSMTADHLREAAAVLREGTDAVAIPAEDGGYVLIGLRAPQPKLFSGIAWSTDTVMLETRRRFVDLGLTFQEPAHLWDVDRPSDVRRMRREGMEELLVGIGREQMTPETMGFPWTPPHARRTA